MANRFLSAVKTTTINVSQFAYETRYQGHGSIIRRIAAHDGLDVLIEEVLDALMKSAKPGASAGQIAEKAMQSLDGTGFSVGQIAAKLITQAPDLVAQLIADGAVLVEGETRADFLSWLDSLSLPEIVEIARQWFDFNFQGGLGPFVQGLKDAFAVPGAAPDQAAPKNAAAGFRRR